MSKFEKAVDFYLRGFNSQYIKRRTEISMQSLLKQLLAKGVRYSKDDIFRYQIEYIGRKYSVEDVEQAYRDIMSEYSDPFKAGHGHKITALGCGFGDYTRVFKTLLGEERHKQLRNECWQNKQKQTIRDRYGVDNVFCKESFDNFVSPEAIAQGRDKRTATLIAKYGVPHPNQNEEICNRMKMTTESTNIERYGFSNPMQNADVASKSAKHRQQVMLERYGAKNSVEIPHVREKIFESRKQNKTLNTSRAEELLGCLLISHFGECDVSHNVIVDNRYPYHVDYYIKSLDLFIELNGDKCHNDHWFDCNDERDLQILNSWMENMFELEAKTGKVSRYRKYIKTWTQTDVAKRNKARDNCLNYIVFWDGSCKQVNKKQIPRLGDVYSWFEAGCPNSCDWLQENTY